MTARGLASSSQSRIKALQLKHALLKGQIHEAQNCPSTTDFYLRQLKKQRLYLKDELESIRSSAH